MDICDIGKLTDTKCYLNTYSNLQTLHDVQQLTSEDRLLLKIRLNNPEIITQVCDYHKKRYLNYYSEQFRKCCDPFETHKKIIRKKLRILSLKLCMDASTVLSLNLMPGNKICKRCQNYLRQKIASQNKNNNSTSQKTIEQCNMMEKRNTVDNREGLRRSTRILKNEKFTTQGIISDSQRTDFTNSSHLTSSDYEFMTESQDNEVINNILTSLDLPTYKQQAFRKYKSQVQAENLVQQVSHKFAEKFFKAADLKISIPNPVNSNFHQDSFALREMLINLRHLFDNAKTISQKLEYLALLPKDWTLPKVSEHFNCTNYMWSKFNKFKQMNGYPENLRTHERKKIVKCNLEIQEKIIDYYRRDENCSTCPGKRDYVTGRNNQGRKIFIQKKLLLYTLHDLYLKFIDENSGTHEKLQKFSYFASLKPPEIIHAGDPGSHNICVCAQHENVKLKLQSITRKIKYRDLLQSAVCNVDNDNCMLHKCDNCPKIIGMEEVFAKNNVKCEKESVSYKSWVDEGSRASLQTLTAKADDFKLALYNDIWDLTQHHYIADAQKRYLSHCKANLETDTCVIMMDFSENYSFIIQNSVQAFYYNNSQATIHPFAIYYKNKENELSNINFCVISDTTEHFAYTIHAFMNKLMSAIKDKLAWIKKVIYFSDGAPSQYKNKNHLANIYCHEEDFNIEVTSYNFFATSHGKSLCDAIGGTMKRLVMRHCLRAPPEKQISTPLQMYEYAIQKSENIGVLWVPHTEVKKHEKKLKRRFLTVKTIPNTRQYHCFIPVGGSSFQVKITSFDDYLKKVNLLLPKNK